MARYRKMANRAPSRCGACGDTGHIVTSCQDGLQRARYYASQLYYWNLNTGGALSWATKAAALVLEQLEREVERRPSAPLDRVA
jgi:hypothetical protein